MCLKLISVFLQVSVHMSIRHNDFSSNSLGLERSRLIRCVNFSIGIAINYFFLWAVESEWVLGLAVGGGGCGISHLL